MYLALRICTLALLSGAMLCAAGCASYETTLVNDRGQTQICKGGGWVGPVTQLVSHERYKDCVSQAKKSGFKESKAGGSKP